MKCRILALLLCAVMLLNLAGCSKTPPAETAAPATVSTAATTAATEPSTVPAPTEPDNAQLYAQAKAPLLAASDLAVKITENRSMSIADEEYILESRQNLRYTGIGTDNMQIARTEELENAFSSDKFEEFYCDGMLYVTVYNEFDFCGAMDQAHYLSQLIPSVLLDETLYGQITSSQDGANTQLLFLDPTGPEAWAMPEGARFHSAEGSALLDSAGNLLETRYRIEYTYGSSQVIREITAAPSLEAIALTAPSPDGYTRVDSIEGLKLYESAIMHLYTPYSVTTVLTETMISQAAGCVYTVQETVDYWGAGDDYIARVDSTVTFQQLGSNDSYNQTELFRDGVYTVTAQGDEPQTNAAVTLSLMSDYCLDFLSENIVALDYVENITAEQIGGILFLELEYTDDYGDFLCDYVCSVLFDDENLLTDLATAEELKDCSGYMSLDIYTGLPTSVGMLYSADHTIDGTAYTLTLQADQSFYLTSQTAYETITGELLPETAPEECPTPLFYKVTGDDGQQMWLLGTIHVGDAATAFLPQEIYDALLSSDALAVEADMITFEEQLATDQALATQVLSAYLYPDGSAAKDHLSEETYSDAVKLLKASGSYNASVEMMKPSMWQSSLSNFYIRLGYGLQTEKGVDMRLLKLAKEKNIPILEVESGLFQMQMFGSYSDALQAFLLESLLAEDPAQYYADTLQLYALWCDGDEAILREAVLEDTSELTEEELALYKEYDQAMIVDRNEGMLNVAIQYLESGDTVFYAVGLAHLLTDNGLVNTLRDAGYTVELVPYA